MKRQKNKKNVAEHRTSLNELHNKKLDEFEDLQKALPQKEKKLKKLQSKVNPTKEDLEKIENLTNEVNRIKNQDDMTEYLLSIHSVLKLKSEEPSVSDTSIYNGFIITEKKDKEKLLDEYLYVTNGCRDVNKIIKEYNDTDFVCNGCGQKNMIVNYTECYLTCRDCGLSKEWRDPNLAQWSDETDVTKAYRYNRHSYFEENLNQYQAKENITFPQELIDSILSELSKRGIDDPEQVNRKLIKSILKSLNKPAFYDHINSIIRRITGKKAPKMTKELESNLKNMFYQIQEPFEKHKGLIKSRNNFLSYPYCIRKLLEIIAYDKNNKIKEAKGMIEEFALLRSHQKIVEQEKIWKKICEDLGWPFYRSL